MEGGGECLTSAARGAGSEEYPNRAPSAWVRVVTESRQVNAVCREALSPYGAWRRVENRLPPGGCPDAAYALLGVCGVVELKLGLVEGKCPEHLTFDQIIWGRIWTASPAHGLWHLLLLVDRVWLLYDLPGATKLFEGHGSFPLVRHEGSFPRTAILNYLAPAERRIITRKERRVEP